MAFEENALTQTSVQLTVSPVTYAIALDPDDPDQLRVAVSTACRYWGGLRFPWLLLANDGTVTGGAERLCDVLDVVGIIDLTRADAREPVAPGLGSLSVDCAPLASWPRLGMPIRGVVAPISDDPLMTADEMDHGVLDPVALLGLGYLSPDERAAWEEAGQEIAMPAADSYLLPQLQARTAVGVTATAVDNFISTSAIMTSTALVWVLPDEFTTAEVAQDLASFWTYRALRLRHRGTITVLTRLSSLREQNAGRRLVEAVSATALSTPMCVFNGLAVGKEQLAETAEALGFRVIPADMQWQERLYQPHEALELTAVVDHPLAGLWIQDRYTGASSDTMAIASRPRWQARIQSPLQWRYPEALAGLVSARVTSSVITGPPVDPVAALYERNGRWRAGGIRVITYATPDYNFDIGMPQPADVLAAAIADRDRRFSISDKGREIDGILAASNDLSLFRRPAFHAVTAAMTPAASPRIERALKSLAEQIAADPDASAAAQELRDITAWARARPMTLREIASNRAVTRHSLGRGDVIAVLTDMVARGLARWGYERRCSLCGLNELVSLTDAVPVPHCAGCGRDAAYAIREGEPELHYVLGSLLQRVSKNAGLAPLAAAAAFRQQGYYIVPGADIFPNDGKKETDLLGWKDYRLLAGEAKAAASLFTTENIAQDLQWAAGIGATSYVLVCPEQLPTPLVQEAIETAEDQGLEVLQLTGPALTSGMPPQPAFIQVAEADAASRPTPPRLYGPAEPDSDDSNNR